MTAAFHERQSGGVRIKTRFGVMRHAETFWNREKRIQGQKDTRLTPEGEAAADTWGNRIAGYAWTQIVSSDLIRARETARRINETLHLPLSADRRLREQHWGEWEGLTWTDIQKRFPKILAEQIAAGWGFRPPGGESREAVYRRVSDFLAEQHRRDSGGSVLVVTHGGVIRCLVYRLLNRKFLPDEPPVLGARQLHLLSVDKTQLSLDQLNADDFSAP
jgi:probable phosphoglycerate mutase